MEMQCKVIMLTSIAIDCKFTLFGENYVSEIGSITYSINADSKSANITVFVYLFHSALKARYLMCFLGLGRQKCVCLSKSVEILAFTNYKLLLTFQHVKHTCPILVCTCGGCHFNFTFFVEAALADAGLQTRT